MYRDHRQAMGGMRRRGIGGLQGMATGGMIEEGGVDVPQPRIPAEFTDGVEVLNFDSTAPLPELENPNMPTAADLPVPDMEETNQLLDLIDGNLDTGQDTMSQLMGEAALGEPAIEIEDPMMGGEAMMAEMPMDGIAQLGMMGGGYVPMVYASGGYIPSYGIGGFFKKVAKGALKVAPMAAMAIPGLGPLASGAIGGIAGTLGNKLEGGGWGSALSKGLATGIKSYGGRKAIKGFKEGFDSIGGPGASWQDKLEKGFEGLKGEFSTEDILKMAPMLAQAEAIEQGHAGGAGGDMTSTTIMPGQGGGGGGPVETITQVGEGAATKYNLFDQLAGKPRAGGGSLYAMRRFGGGPIKGYQEGGEFDEPEGSYVRSPREEWELMKREKYNIGRNLTPGYQEAIDKKIEQVKKNKNLSDEEKSARLENIDYYRNRLDVKKRHNRWLPPDTAGLYYDPGSKQWLQPGKEKQLAENIEPALPATFAPPVPPPPPPAPVAPVGTPPLGTLDDQFIDEVEQVLPTTTRSIPETDVSRFGPEVMPEPSEMGEGEGEEGAFTDADPGAYGTPSPRDAATTYPTGLSFEEEVERQVKQAQTEAEEEGEPDEEGVFEDDPMAEKARDLGVTPSGKLDETGDVVRDEEYIAAQGPFMGHGYEQPAPTIEETTVAAPGEGEGLNLFDQPTGQQEPMNIFGAGASPFDMPTRADQFEDPRMQAMLNRLNTDPAPLRKLATGKAEGGVIEAIQQDDAGSEILQVVAEALQDPEDSENAQTIASFQEAFGDDALAELLQMLQVGSEQVEMDMAEPAMAPPAAMQRGGLVPGSGDAMEDNLLGVVDQGQPNAYPVKFSSGEFVVAGDVVAGLGSGNTQAGAEVLNNLQDDVRMARNGTTEQAPPIDLSEVLPGTYGGKYA